MENLNNRYISLIEFLIGFILVGIGIFVYLTVLFCRGFMQLYCDILFPLKSLSVIYGFYLSIAMLSIGFILIYDGYIRFKRIRLIQIKVRKHLPLESVHAKVSRENRAIIYISIYIIVIIVCGLLFRLIYW